MAIQLGTDRGLPQSLRLLRNDKPECEISGLAVGGRGTATHIALTVDPDGKTTAQGHRIQVQNNGGRRVITVHGADVTGAMYGGLDIDYQ